VKCLHSHDTCIVSDGKTKFRAEKLERSALNKLRKDIGEVELSLDLTRLEDVLGVSNPAH
jgi:DNA-nicking Smr family endonuclease